MSQLDAPPDSGSARREKTLGYWWLRRKLKHATALYITTALRQSGMTRVELAAALGVSPGRIAQWISVRGSVESERVPIDLIQQIWNVTKVKPEFLNKRFVPPTHLRQEPPTTH